MAGGKLPPRQKMIGMMYLVLTALLAMNVSKDILDAFILINDGIEKTTSTFNDKNQYIYNEFQSAMNEKPEATKPWYDKAMEVQKVSAETFKYLKKLKYILIAHTDKLPIHAEEIEKAVDGNKPLPVYGLDSVSSKDNYDIPTHTMGLGTDPPAAVAGYEKYFAEEVKKNIDGFRDKLIDIVPKDEQENLRNAIGLSTEDVPDSEGNPEPWVRASFYHTPLAAVVTMISKLQADVKNAEAEALKVLFKNITKGSVSFDAVDGFAAIPKAFVLSGDTFRAQIFTAAYDSKAVPTIYVGQFDSTKVAEQLKKQKSSGGAVDAGALMVGQKTENLQEAVTNAGQMWAEVPADMVKGGKGYVSMAMSGIGVYPFEGLIKIKTLGGEKIYPFKNSFEVGQPSTTVAAEKMNVFYIGVDNPVSISAPVPPEKIRATGLGIRKSGKGWVVRPRTKGEGTISVSAEIDGKVVQLGKAKFRVKRIPDPMPYIGGKTGTAAIKQAQLKATSRVVAKMENFDFDVKPNVTGYMFSYIGSDGLLKEQKVNGASMSSIKGMIGKVRRNSKVYFERITVSMPDGSKRTLPPVILKVI